MPTLLITKANEEVIHPKDHFLHCKVTDQTLHNNFFWGGDKVSMQPNCLDLGSVPAPTPGLLISNALLIGADLGTNPS